MPHPLFERSRLRLQSLDQREHRISAEDTCIDPDDFLEQPPDAGGGLSAVKSVARRIIEARESGASVVLAFGAHAIRNGLGPVMVRMAKKNWVTHFATNGAGSIHDWEFAWIGHTCEHVRRNLADGTFGLWEETGRINGLAIAVGALEGLGYGDSMGALIANDRLNVPPIRELRSLMADAAPAEAAAAADLIDVIDTLGIDPGVLEFQHPYKQYSLQGWLYELGVPITVHPGIGYDIVHAHPAASGGAYGRAAHRDFLGLAESIRGLSGGVYVSMGSAVMSPMVMEKALSMARNVEAREGREVSGFTVCVNDLADPGWDWTRGEPPEHSASYYTRFCKSFARTGGKMLYAAVDNRLFLGRLYAELNGA